MTGHSPLLPTLLRYSGALALVAVAAALSYLTPMLSAAAPFTMFVLACLISARVFGLGPGILTTLAGGIAGFLLFIAPRDPGAFLDPVAGLGVVAYLVVGFVACWATASLRIVHERMIRVLDSISEGFTVADPRGRVLYANRRAAEIARHPADELEGQDAFEAFPAIATEAAREEVRGALRAGRSSRIEVYLAGEERWLESRVVPAEEGFSAFTRDVTEHKLSQRRLAATIAALARSNQALERFARTVSHELVQPLGSMMTYAEVIREQTEGDPQRFSTRIVEVGKRMADMLRGHLHDARALGDPGARETVALDALVSSVAADLSAALAGSGSALTSEGLPVIEGDPALMRQLVHSLVQGVLLDGHPSRLRFSSTRDELGETVIALDVDARPGVTEGDPDPFAHQDDLAIARRIIELHGGRAWTQPAGPGIAIRFTLPAATLPARPVPAPQPH